MKMTKLTAAALLTATAAVSLMLAGTGNRAVTNNPKSPTAETTTMIAGKAVTIEYNAPSARGREVEGGLIPFGGWWRFGADTATTLTTETDLMIGDLHVPKGVYTLYVIADDAKTWKLAVNKQTKQWGTVYKPEMDLGRTAIKLAKADGMVETLKITLKPAALEFTWGKTLATVPLKAM